MKLEQAIEKSIKHFNLEMGIAKISKKNSTFNETIILKEAISNYETAINCMQSELNREKNKVLTFSDLKQMAGKPVWNWDYEIWEIVASYNEEYDEVVIGTKRIREESYMPYYRWEKE